MYINQHALLVKCVCLFAPFPTNPTFAGDTSARVTKKAIVLEIKLKRLRA